jgi:hypothetical protein
MEGIPSISVASIFLDKQFPWPCLHICIASEEENKKTYEVFIIELDYIHFLTLELCGNRENHLTLHIEFLCKTDTLSGKEVLARVEKFAQDMQIRTITVNDTAQIIIDPSRLNPEHLNRDEFAIPLTPLLILSSNIDKEKLLRDFIKEKDIIY